MIQFLKSILFPGRKVRKDRKMKEIKDQVAVLQLRVLALEQENLSLKSAVQDLSTCVTQIAYSLSELCSEAVQAQEQDKILNDYFNLKKDDDGYLN